MQYSHLGGGSSWRRGSWESGGSGKGMMQILLKSTEGLIDFSGLSPRPEMFIAQ